MKVVTLNQNPTMQDALNTVDILRREIAEGKVVAFFVAGLSDDDACIAYIGSSKPVSRLRVTGAMATALHCFNEGEV